VKFVVYGDTRGVWDNWQQAEIVAKAIEEQQPYFVLHTGDLVKSGYNQSQWIEFFTNSEFIHNSTLYPSLGNHEYHGRPYFKYFSLPNNELWYSFDNGPVHFVALDSTTGIVLKLFQLLWLRKDLRTNNQPFTIVFFHHPLYSSGNHGSTLHLRWLWQPDFERFNVDIVFNGHDHSYERGQVNNVSYIVTGGGGGPLYDVGSNWWTIYSEKTYHYCLVTANQTQLTFQAIKPNGTIFDSFIINES
jgi:3',5'-cyclic AMP phosphodiesterase CpdA